MSFCYSLLCAFFHSRCIIFSSSTLSSFSFLLFYSIFLITLQFLCANQNMPTSSMLSSLFLGANKIPDLILESDDVFDALDTPLENENTRNAVISQLAEISIYRYEEL